MNMDLSLIALIAATLLLVQIAIGVPIFLSLMTTACICLLTIVGTRQTLALLTTVTYGTTAQFTFSTIPFFILMGSFTGAAGIAQSAYDLARVWLGGIRGGLAMATTGACAMFAAASGSSLATAATFSRIAFPEMRRYGYSPKLAAAAIAASGTLASMIPPSGLMVVFSMLTEVSLGPLLIAGFIPGGLTAIIYMSITFVWVTIRPGMAPLVPSIPLKQRWPYFKGGVPVGLIVLVIFGGIYSGVFTPTEAGAVGAFVSFVYLVLRRGKATLQVTRESIIDTAVTTSRIFIIIIGAFMLGKFLALSGISQSVATFLTELPVPKIVVVITVLLLYLLLGMFMDPSGMLAITLPILWPALDALGVNGVWFGILCIKLSEMGFLTPPVGLNCYVVKSVLGDAVNLEDIFKGVMPFLIADFITCSLLLAFPIISLWLPGIMVD